MYQTDNYPCYFQELCIKYQIYWAMPIGNPLSTFVSIHWQTKIGIAKITIKITISAALSTLHFYFEVPSRLKITKSDLVCLKVSNSS